MVRKNRYDGVDKGKYDRCHQLLFLLDKIVGALPTIRKAQ
jgi:hypothetical protein